MKTIVVIYHRADLDGIFSREIAKKFFGDAADYIGWDYGDPLPVVPRSTRLYMIDISVDGMMDHPELIWIDHHKSAIEKFDLHGTKIHGYRIDGVAACRLAWQWFNHPFSPENPFCSPVCYDLPQKDAYVQRVLPEPLAVRLAGEYDIWDKRDPRAELFQHGMRSCEPHFSLLLDDDFPIGNAYVAKLLDAGGVLQFAQTKQNESIIKQAGFTVHFEGLTLLACNNARYNSHLFTAGLKPEHDGCLGFAWAGTKWRVSLYGVPGKPDINLSEIAVRHGGGGHKQACGFECAELPFKLRENAA